MIIEVVHVRAPDDGCELRVFVDGEVVDHVICEDVDAGRGYTHEDWQEHTDWVTNNPDYSAAFKGAVVALREDPPGDEYLG